MAAVSAKFTDVHVHLLALPTPRNGCWVSPRMLRKPLSRAISWIMDLPIDDPETTNRRYLDRLRAELDRSSCVSAVVLLGMDGVYVAGRLARERTDFLISNDAVFDAAGADPRFLAGVSINPTRADALDEVDRCADRGAALVKWLPNAQAFDPADARWRPFYRRLAARGLPLLSHIGVEYSLIGQDQSVADPGRLRCALDEGVTVIAAHGCSTGLFVVERHVDTMVRLVRRYPNFYVDVSALTLPNRAGMLLRIRRRPELFERLLFGTDYPLPCFSYPPLLLPSMRGFDAARRAPTRFDRTARVLEAMGIRLTADLRTLGSRVE